MLFQGERLDPHGFSCFMTPAKWNSIDPRSFEARLVSGKHHILILKTNTIRSPNSATNFPRAMIRSVTSSQTLWPQTAPIMLSLPCYRKLWFSSHVHLVKNRKKLPDGQVLSRSPQIMWIFYPCPCFLVTQLKNAAGSGDYANSYIATWPAVLYNILLLHIFFYMHGGIIIANTKVAYVFLIVSKSYRWNDPRWGSVILCGSLRSHTLKFIPMESKLSQTKGISHESISVYIFNGYVVQHSYRPAETQQRTTEK